MLHTLYFLQFNFYKMKEPQLLHKKVPFQTDDLHSVKKKEINKIILRVILLILTSSLLVSFSTLSLQIVIGTQLSYPDLVMETLPRRDVQT